MDRAGATWLQFSVNREREGEDRQTPVKLILMHHVSAQKIYLKNEALMLSDVEVCVLSQLVYTRILEPGPCGVLTLACFIFAFSTTLFH